MKQDNTIYTFSIKVSFSSKGQNKSKLQKQISNILIEPVMAAWYNDRNDVRRWWHCIYACAMCTVPVLFYEGYLTFRLKV